MLDVTSPDEPGGPLELDDDGAVLRPAHIGCTEPGVFASVSGGQAIWFNDASPTPVGLRPRQFRRLSHEVSLDA
jgi:hypothetical protein